MLYGILSPRLMAFLLTLVRDRHIAEDILQQASVGTWSTADVIHDDASKIEQSLYDASDDIQSRRTERRLSDCMEEIGNDPATCLRLTCFQGFSFREIASLRERLQRRTICAKNCSTP